MSRVDALVRAAVREQRAIQKKAEEALLPREPGSRKRRRPRKPVPKTTRITRGDLNRAVAGRIPLTPHVRRRMAEHLGLLRCPSCDQVKAATEFTRTASGSCKECVDAAKGSYILTPEAFVRTNMRDVRTRSAMRDVEVSITDAWVVHRFQRIGGKCELCGGLMTTYKTALAPPDLKKSSRFNTIPSNLSIDQRAPSGGYTEANAQLVHVRCNLMKLDMPMAEFTRACADIAAKAGLVAALVPRGKEIQDHKYLPPDPEEQQQQQTQTQTNLE